MGEKFIIELEDEVNGLRKAKGFNTLVFDQNGVNKLTPYEEKKETSNGRWKPEKNKLYWFINNCGIISSVPWYDDEADQKVYAVGNCFRTKEEAEFAVEKLKVIAELKEYTEPKRRKSLRQGTTFPHWHISYDLAEKRVIYTFGYTTVSGDLSFVSEDMAKQAVAAVGENRVKKYYLEVE